MLSDSTTRRGRTIGQRRREIVTRMKFSRRLQQAIDECARVEVLRNALVQARAAGCENSELHAAIILRGEAVLSQIEVPEVANSNGASVHHALELPRLLGSIPKLKLSLDYADASARVSGQNVVKHDSQWRKTPCSNRITMENTPTSSETEISIASSSLQKEADEVAEEQERIRARLKDESKNLSRLASVLGVSIITLNASILSFEELVGIGREVGLEEAELAQFGKVIPAARKMWACVSLQSVLEKARTVDLRNDDLGLVVDLRTQLFEAVVHASTAGLLEPELREAEALRKKIHHTIEDRKGVVRLYCRARPLHRSEIDSSAKVVVRYQDTFSLELFARDEKKTFSFDACWAPGSQECVFDESKDLVQSAVDGYNATIFAFGQTGSGKTYTMHGEGDSSEQGICPRTVEELFAIVARKQDRHHVKVSVTMIELYCKRLNDLLDIGSKKTMRIRTDKRGSVYVENVHEQIVTNSQEVRSLLDAGIKARHCRETQMSVQSSRSHLLVTLRVTSTSRETGESVSGKLLLVDLAGSERVGRSGVSGDGLREACEINASLSALGDVLHALVRNDRHVPYRNHELTQLMQDSLGGTAKTLMFVNISPTITDLDETLMSLKFAQRAKGVVNDYGGKATAGPKSPSSVSSRTSFASSRASLLSTRSSSNSSLSSARLSCASKAGDVQRTRLEIPGRVTRAFGFD